MFLYNLTIVWQAELFAILLRLLLATMDNMRLKHMFHVKHKGNMLREKLCIIGVLNEQNNRNC
jgi:hypothetical protein